MYQKYFGFVEKPFDVTPDPRFLFLSEHHQEALASIIYGIRERRGFITLVGEVGTGKTTLLNATLESLDENTHTAFIFNTDVNFEELLQMVLVEFDLAGTDEVVQKHAALARLNRFATEQFAGGGNVALLIDEAQNLDTRTMENLRLLSNLETRRHKLIQIVLSGQPELDENLRKNELRQLAQRINMRRYIMPLNERDTYQYILQHLDKAGYEKKSLFDRASLKQIWDFSRGVPRKINLLCDNTLLIAYGLGKKKISKAIVDEAIRDLNWSPYDNKFPEPHPDTRQLFAPVKARPPRQRHFTIAAILLLSLLLGAGSFGFLHMQTDGLQDLTLKAKQYFAGILSVDPTEKAETSGLRQRIEPDASGRSSILEFPDSGAASKPPAEPETEKMPQPEAVPELPEHAEIVIKDFPAPATDRKVDQQAPAPARTIVNAPETAKDSELTVKKPKSNELSADKRKILEEDILTQPVSTSSGHSGNRSKNDLSDSSYHAPIALTAETGRTVVVRKNDYLARIIRTNYGNESENVLEMVLQANPQIQNPNLIVPGQVIRLPEIGGDKDSGERENLLESPTGSRKKKTTRSIFSFSRDDRH